MRTLVSASLIGLLLTLLAGCATTANPSPAASAGRPGDTASALSPWLPRIQAP